MPACTGYNEDILLKRADCSLSFVNLHLCVDICSDVFQCARALGRGVEGKCMLHLISLIVHFLSLGFPPCLDSCIWRCKDKMQRIRSEDEFQEKCPSRRRHLPSWTDLAKDKSCYQLPFSHEHALLKSHQQLIQLSSSSLINCNHSITIHFGEGVTVGQAYVPCSETSSFLVLEFLEVHLKNRYILNNDSVLSLHP